MTTELTKPVSRETKMTDDFNVTGPVIATMSVHGIELRRKGTSRKLHISWSKIGKLAEIPGNAPAKYLSNPMGWLVEKKND
tara:strand:- start:9587 stop:9829 length:243 start_codon:yes stop_codon:yes gene_type:complete